MTFSIAGTGNIGWFFGTRLVATGHTCTGVYGRDLVKAQALAAVLHTTGHLLPSLTDARADICFLAVSDSAIGTVAAYTPFTATTVAHMAGSLPLSALGQAVHQAVLWPVYSISKAQLPTLPGIPCAWEAGSPQATAHIQQAAAAITTQAFHAGHQQRMWLHLTAVLGNNFVNHLLSVCQQVCGQQQLPFSALLPIIHQTVDRLATASAAELQTGPAIRGDQETIDRHLAMLGGHPAWQQVYSAITHSIQAQHHKQA